MPKARVRTDFTAEEIAAHKQALRPRHYILLISRLGAPLPSYSDIALSLNIPPGTVKSRLNRARIKLAKLIDKVKADAT